MAKRRKEHRLEIVRRHEIAPGDHRMRLRQPQKLRAEPHRQVDRGLPLHHVGKPQRVGNNLRHGGQRSDEFLHRQQLAARRHLRHRRAGAVGAAGQDRGLRLMVGAADLHRQREPVELAFGKVEGADLLGRVLRRDDKEGPRQVARLAVHGHGALLHRLQQRRLRLRRRAVQLVGKQHLREDGPLAHHEAAALAVEHRQAGDVGRKQVVGALHALEIQPERRRQRRRQRGLAASRRVLDQKVAVGKDAGQRQLDSLPAAEEAQRHRIDDGGGARRDVGGRHVGSGRGRRGGGSNGR